MNNNNNFPLDFVQCCFLFLKQLPTGTLLPCSVLILSMAKNQSDVENLVKNCLMVFCHSSNVSLLKSIIVLLSTTSIPVLSSHNLMRHTQLSCQNILNRIQKSPLPKRQLPISLQPQGVDLAYLQTGISGVFVWVLNFENLYFLGVLATATVFFGLLNKCRISLGC